MEQDLPKEAGAQMPANGPGMWQRIQSWDSRLSVTKGLTAVTLLTGLVGGYFQYTNSYDQKMSEQAKADMDMATKTFIEISNAFAEVQMLQEGLLPEQSGAPKPQLGAGFMQVDAKALAPGADYWKARTSLRQNGAIFGRKAEIYIDWPSDLGRDPAGEHTLDQDPLTETLLTKYNFDCDSEANLPQFKGAIFSGADPGRPSEELCTDPAANGPKAYLDLCARQPDGAINPLHKVVNVNWWSAKHHVLVMNHCAETLYSQLGMLQTLAPGSDAPRDRKPEVLKLREINQHRLQLQARRLDAFMTLTMAQLDRIRVRYRPTGLLCYLTRETVGFFGHGCSPTQPVTNAGT
jgi:hypothetical protein